MDITWSFWGKPKHATRRLLELIRGFHKAADYKIKVQKSTTFLHTNNVSHEKELTGLVPFIVSKKKIHKQITLGQI